MITSKPFFAASIPPAAPRQDITVAPSASSPSRISSQPMILRPRSLRYFWTRAVT